VKFLISERILLEFQCSRVLSPFYLEFQRGLVPFLFDLYLGLCSLQDLKPCLLTAGFQFECFSCFEFPGDLSQKFGDLLPALYFFGPENCFLFHKFRWALNCFIEIDFKQAENQFLVIMKFDSKRAQVLGLVLMLVAIFPAVA
jgi:hypothetical protein